MTEGKVFLSDLVHWKSVLWPNFLIPDNTGCCGWYSRCHSWGSSRCLLTIRFLCNEGRNWV